MISNQANAGGDAANSTGAAQEVAEGQAIAKPEFGPSASKILAPSIQGI